MGKCRIELIVEVCRELYVHRWPARSHPCVSTQIGPAWSLTVAIGNKFTSSWTCLRFLVHLWSWWNFLTVLVPGPPCSSTWIPCNINPFYMSLNVDLVIPNLIQSMPVFVSGESLSWVWSAHTLWPVTGHVLFYTYTQSSIWFGKPRSVVLGGFHCCILINSHIWHRSNK